MNPTEESLKDRTVVLTNQPDKIELTRSDSTGEILKSELFLDKYEIVGVLGHGGMGSVYKARHILLDKMCALKVLHSAQADGEAVLRFQQEAKVVSSLKHPNIVSVHDFGVSPREGTPYMVMDLLDGVPLNTFLKEVPDLSVERLARICGQVCDALGYAHERAIVHRDIKPGNIMIQTKDGMDHVTVVDFGIAKIIPTEDSAKMHLTKTGDVFGTPLYMSPEQCLGHTVDARADIYALGCVMYEAFMGRHPFATDNMFDLVNKHIRQTPTPFNKAGMTASEHQFEVIVLRAMAKDPQDRYRYAVEMASDLKSVEKKPTSLVDEMKVRIKVQQTRAKASSKASRWWHAIAVVLTLSAIVQCTLLFALPFRMSEEVTQMNRYSTILSALEDSVATTDSNGTLVPTPIKLESSLEKVADLVLADPEQRQPFAELRKLLPAGEKLLKRAERLLAIYVLDLMHQGVMQVVNSDAVAMVQAKVGPISTQIEGHWTKIGLQFSKLVSISYGKCKVHMERTIWYLHVQHLLQVTSIVTLIALVILFLARFSEAKRGSVQVKKLPAKN